ncbi:MAG: DUF2330 domain-containing protein [Verrucomicrobiae bacterium]|nr:DUF2330 domain-containing protein [Verrucomicrobiae bacterium]
MTRNTLSAKSHGLFYSPLPLALLPGLLIVALFAPLKAPADGMFVAPKFVWDKHRDINEPSQKAIIVYDAGREDLILQVKYEGPVNEFGWLIPVPNLPTVKKGSMKCFYELSQYTQRHFETEWLHHPSKGGDEFMAASLGAPAPEPPVKVIEIKTVGAYEIAVLSTKDSQALTGWLATNQFYFPADKTDVLDCYIKQHWCFVAVKINLARSGSSATASRLANGELNPLQLSFASDHCVFPLKISSVNGRPSEVQLYVLSPEPLLENTMLEKKLPRMYTNSLAQAARKAESYRHMRQLHLSFSLPGQSSPPPLLSLEEKHIEQIRQTPQISPDELLPFGLVTNTDLPDSIKSVPRLADKSWWLTKQTWTFQPADMRDLEFDPAIPIFSRLLNSKYSYYATASLGQFGSAAVPAVLIALQDTNPAVRISAASILDPMRGSLRDERFTEPSLALLQDPEPEVRTAAANVLGDFSHWNPKFVAPLVAALNDDNVEVRVAAESGLEHHPADVSGSIPQLQAMLKKNPGTRASAFEVLHRLNVPVARADLLAIFEVPRLGAVWDAYNQLKNETGKDISLAEAPPLLQNPDPNVRGGLGLQILYQNAGKPAVEMALPLLKDPEKLVQIRAAQTLRAMTGQPFTEEPAGAWENWWALNKTNFVAQLHPEELPRQRFHPATFSNETVDKPPVRTPPAVPPP